MNSLEQAEDLKAFERRLTEYIHCLQPATGRWRMLLIVVSVCTATGAWNWLIDPETQKVSFFTSLWNHPFFTISCITLIGLFFAGIHKRVVAPSIIAARCRTVLAEYNMSCDDTDPELTSMPIFLYFICGTPATAWHAKQCHVRTWDPNRRTP
uniref:Nuclear envelope phosphatase-regulatory subunit 1 n=1 Tax=Equus asinus TaxID=9793 RepID=A0A9L0ILM9_EQUAS